MFCGRTEELEALERRYNSGRFEFLPVYGRRRVGKTALLKEFARGKNAVYFAAAMGPLSYNLRRLADAVAGRPMGLMDMDGILDLVRARSRDGRFLLIIDEFPYMETRDGRISGALQRFIDEEEDDSGLFLILCGSSMSMMEHEVLGYKSPLYGRRTGSIRLRPLTFRECMPMLEGFSLEDRVRIFTMVGGIPLYLRQFDPSLSIRDNIVEKFLRVDSFFVNEPYLTLSEEFENPRTYYSVLSSIASGKSKNSEISNDAGLSPALNSRYLDDLVDLGIVRRDHPVDRPQGKMTRYSIDDEFLAFHFRHLSGRQELDTDEMVPVAESILRKLQDDIGFEFERICASHMKSEFGGEIGRWWGGDPVTKRQEEIDIVLTKRTDDIVVGYFAECKYKNEKTGREILNDLKRKSELVKGYPEKRYVLYSKEGFEGLDGSDAYLFTLRDVAGPTDGSRRET